MANRQLQCILAHMYAYCETDRDQCLRFSILMLRGFRWSYAACGCIDLTKTARDAIAPFLQDLYDKAPSLCEGGFSSGPDGHVSLPVEQLRQEFYFDNNH